MNQLSSPGLYSPLFYHPPILSLRWCPKWNQFLSSFLSTLNDASSPYRWLVRTILTPPPPRLTLLLLPSTPLLPSNLSYTLPPNPPPHPTPPSLPPYVLPLRHCSWQTAGRFQYCGDSRGGVRPAPPVAGGPPLLPEQEQQVAMWQEGQEGRVSREEGWEWWGGGVELKKDGKPMTKRTKEEGEGISMK